MEKTENNAGDRKTAYTETGALAIVQECCRFNKCSVPKCPLDLLQDRRTKLQDEPKCTLAKSVRYRIGKDTPLPYKGLTRNEWAAKRRWESLPDEEKARRREFMREITASQRNHGPGSRGTPLEHKSSRERDRIEDQAVLVESMTLLDGGETDRDIRKDKPR